MTLDIGSNMLDGGAPYYQVYETADGKFMAVGAIENRFYKELLNGLGLGTSSLSIQNDKEKWPEMITRFAEIFKTKTREEWTDIFEGTDANVTPVLELNEVDQHPHNRERGLLFDEDGILLPFPAPRRSRTPSRVKKSGKQGGSETEEILKELDYSRAEIQAFYGDNIVE